MESAASGHLLKHSFVPGPYCCCRCRKRNRGQQSRLYRRRKLVCVGTHRVCSALRLESAFGASKACHSYLLDSLSLPGPCTHRGQVPPTSREAQSTYARLSGHKRPCADPENHVSSSENQGSDIHSRTSRSSSHTRGPTADPYQSGQRPRHANARTHYPVRVGAPTCTVTPSPARVRWQNAVRSVLLRRNASRDNDLHNDDRRSMIPSDIISSGRADASELPDSGVQQSARAPMLTAKLRDLRPAESLSTHRALVRHLQFSPNGNLLATSSWDRTSVILRAVSPFTPHRTLAHPSGFVSEVAWSPSGTRLLTKLHRSVKVWTEVR